MISGQAGGFCEPAGKDEGEDATRPTARAHVILAQVRAQATAQDLERRALANTVGADKSEHLTRTRHGQAA